MKSLQGPIQEALLSLLCFDNGRGAEVALLLKPTDFDPVYRAVAELAFEYRNRHKKAPGEHTADLIDTIKERDEELAETYDRLLGSLEASSKELNPDFVLDRASKFVRYQRLMSAIKGALTDLQKDKEDSLLAAEAKLSKALRETAPVAAQGLDMLDDLEGTLSFLEQQDDILPTGIKEFDAVGLGPARKKLHFFQAPYGSGKSWWLLQLAHEARKFGKNVLYISLEMSREDLAQRYCQRVLALPKRQVAKISWQTFLPVDDPRDAGVRMKEKSIIPDFAILDPAKEGELRRRIKDVSGQGRFKVYEFPTGRFSPADLDNHMTLLSDRERFVPDLVLVDYANIMRKDESLEPWDGTLRVVEELRALAQDWNVAVATVGQVTSEGLKAKSAGKEHAQGSRAVMGVIDVGFAFAQTDAEKQLGLARVKAIKGRQEADGFTVLISQSYATGRFACDSILMGSQYMESLT